MLCTENKSLCKEALDEVGETITDVMIIKMGDDEKYKSIFGPRCSLHTSESPDLPIC